MGSVFGGTIGFLLRHWKATLIVLAISGAGWYVWDLYDSNQSLTQEIENVRDENLRVKAVRDNLIENLEQIEEDMSKLEEERENLQGQVDESEEVIDEIQRERDRALWELENVDIPDDCESAVDWLVDRFQILGEDNE